MGPLHVGSARSREFLFQTFGYCVGGVLVHGILRDRLADGVLGQHNDVEQARANLLVPGLGK